MDAEVISETLEALSDGDTARTRQREVHTLRGVRGVPNGEIARVAAATWQDDRPRLPDDEASLRNLFGTAFEDGLVAIALAAALLPDDADAAMDLGLDWLQRVDDVATADALGWVVLGPAMLAGGGTLDEAAAHAASSVHPEARRAVMMAGLAMTPTPLEGPAAAALRARTGQQQLQFVEACDSPRLHRLAHTYLRDEAPSVRKALRRVLVAWAESDPTAVEAWIDSVRGGLPKMIKEALVKAVRKGHRKAAG